MLSEREERNEFVKFCWAFLGETDVPITCTIFRTSDGLEVRCSQGQWVDTHRAIDLDDALDVAAQIKAGMVRDGGFSEIWKTWM